MGSLDGCLIFLDASLFFVFRDSSIALVIHASFGWLLLVICFSVIGKDCSKHESIVFSNKSNALFGSSSWKSLTQSDSFNNVLNLILFFLEKFRSYLVKLGLLLCSILL